MRTAGNTARRLFLFLLAWIPSESARKRSWQIGTGLSCLRVKQAQPFSRWHPSPHRDGISEGPLLSFWIAAKLNGLTSCMFLIQRYTCPLTPSVPLLKPFRRRMKNTQETLAKTSQPYQNIPSTPQWAPWKAWIPARLGIAFRAEVRRTYPKLFLWERRTTMACAWIGLKKRRTYRMRLTSQFVTRSSKWSI